LLGSATILVALLGSATVASSPCAARHTKSIASKNAGQNLRIDSVRKVAARPGAPNAEQLIQSAAAVVAANVVKIGACRREQHADRQNTGNRYDRQSLTTRVFGAESTAIPRICR